MAWDLTESLKALRAEIKQGMPNVTIYTIGDEAHRQHTSDHNPDDTSGSRAEQSDSDSAQEVRAIDIMLNVSSASMRIVQALTDSRSRARLKYVIHGGKIWSRSNGWVVRSFTSDPHNDHIHVSGYAGDDANGAGWPAVAEIWENDMALTQADADLVASTMISKSGNLYSRVEAIVALRQPFANGAGTEQNQLALKLTSLDQKLTALATAVGEIDEVDTSALEAQLTAIQAEVGQVDEAVLTGLGAVQTPQEQADLLRAVLGDRAQEVGALLAAG